MSDPVAVPVEPTPETVIEKSERSAHDEGEILDEGLDLAGYKATHDSPYVADYFGVRDLYKFNPEVQQRIDSITEHLINETENQSLVFAVKSILDQYTADMNLQEKDTGLHKSKKVLELIKAKNKLQALEAMKEKAIQDINRM